MKTINELIIDNALIWVGEEEIRGNIDFKSPVFGSLMKQYGFKSGDPWCALFTELVWTESYKVYDKLMITRLQKLFSKSAFISNSG